MRPSRRSARLAKEPQQRVFARVHHTIRRRRAGRRRWGLKRRRGGCRRPRAAVARPLAPGSPRRELRRRSLPARGEAGLGRRVREAIRAAWHVLPPVVCDRVE
eukprot:1660378-Prymnesium_polylepis.1